MSKSSLTNVTILTNHYSSRQGNKIDKITIHHMAGNLSVESCGRVFQNREASSNYGIGSDGRVGCYVEEEYRAWCTANPANDRRAINIEVANDGGAPDWHVSDTALAKLIDLCVDICQRNGISRLNYTGTKDGNLTRHNMFMATTCPGPYLQSKFPYIADEVNKRLGPTPPTPPTPTPTHQIKVDGYWGQDTTRKAQEVFGTGYVDGIVSNQYRYYASKNPGLLSSTFQWLDNPKGGSNLIYAMQKWLGVYADGFIGTNTIKALQRKFGCYQDGFLSAGSPTIKKFQEWLNQQ